jgi:sporulation protein YlmC with PRC-barrel domain
MGWYAPGGYYPFVQPLYVRISEKNIPDNMVALQEGAKVFTSGGEHVGNIDQLIVDENNEYVTHLVVSSGLLMKERKMIPAYWLTNVSDNEVHLAVDSRFLDRLPEFNP